MSAPPLWHLLDLKVGRKFTLPNRPELGTFEVVVRSEAGQILGHAELARINADLFFVQALPPVEGGEVGERGSDR